ncbi:hypothetical protein [Flavobacterium sp. DSP2-3-1]
MNHRGISFNHKTASRLMKLLLLKSLIRVKKYKFYKVNKVK